MRQTCSPKAYNLSLSHFPLLDTSRPILLHRDFKAQPRRRHGFEGELSEAILLDAVRLGRFDRLPRLAVLVKDAPGGWRAAFAVAGVVVPIDFDFGDGRGLLECGFHPFRRALLGPPVEINIRVVARRPRLGLIVDGDNQVWVLVFRCANFAPRSDCWRGRQLYARLVVWEPDGHLAAPTVGPGVIGDRGEILLRFDRFALGV